LRLVSEREAGSAWAGVAGEFAVVLAGDAAGDREAESAAWGCGVEADGAFEDAFAFVFGDAGAAVGDLDLDVTVGACQAEVDVSVGGSGDRVVEQVSQDPVERVRVAVDGRFVIEVECHAGGGVGLCVVDCFSSEVCEGDWVLAWLCFEACESEQVVDEAAEAAGVSGKLCLESVAFRAFGLLTQECFCTRLQGGDRGA